MNCRGTTIGLFSSVFLMMIGVGMIVAVLPQHYIALSGNHHTVGSLAASFATTYLMVQLFVGRLAGKYGFRNVLIAGYLICSMAGACFHFSTNALMLIAGRLIQGSGEASVWSLAPAVLAIQNPVKPGRIIGGYSAVLHIGLALGPALGILSRSFMPGSSEFAIFAVLCFTGGLILLCTLKVEPHNREKRRTQSLRRGQLSSLLGKRKVSATLLGVGLYGAGYGSFLTVIPVYLQLVKGFDTIGIGIFFTGFYVTIGLAALLAGSLTDRGGQLPLMLTGIGVAGIGVAFIPILDSAFLVGLLIVSMLALGIFGISSFSYLNRMAAPDLKGTFSGIYFLSWGLGMFFGPLIIGGLEATAEPGTGLQSYGVFASFIAIILHKTLSVADSEKSS